MHNYFKQKRFVNAFLSFKSSIDKLKLNNLAIKKCVSSAVTDKIYLEKSINKLLSLRHLDINQNVVGSHQVSFNKNDFRFCKVSKKCFYERKSLKWYWREKTYDMLDGDIYKNYLIKFKNNFHMELFPHNTHDGKAYDSCLIWLYDGDFPEYFIEHLLEFNNFPPKVFFIKLNKKNANKQSCKKL